MNISVPVDGRMQFSFATAAIANASLGRMPWDGIEQVGPDRYVVRGSWPTPKPAAGGGSFSGLAASQAEPDVGPRSSAGARAIWPQLR
jgi:hypothetical protein